MRKVGMLVHPFGVMTLLALVMGSAIPHAAAASYPPPSTTSPPVISGAAQDGQTLTTTTGSWSSADRLKYSYQWQRCDNTGANCVNVTGATGSSYKLAGADVGNQVTVVVTATDLENQIGKGTAAPAGPVQGPPPPANTVQPVITGWANDGQTLFVNSGSWSSMDPLSYSYQWERCDSTGANCVPVLGATNETYTLGSADDGSQIAAVVSATDLENQSSEVMAAPVGPVTSGPLSGIHLIQHVVIIMQENRSFDSYFGTYPGADGIPGLAGNPGTLPCVPDPSLGGCDSPWHELRDSDGGGPHGYTNALGDIDGGAMDGFVAQEEQKCPTCAHDDVMGYHDSGEIPNYWTYAQDFVLQDHMFSSVLSWSLPEHLYNVSEWSATCSNPLDPFSCVNTPQGSSALSTNVLDTTPKFAWTDLTYLLYEHNISWAYYVSQGTEPDCEYDSDVTCSSVPQNEQTWSIWNPLPHFEDVHQDNQLGNIQSLSNFFSAAQNGTLPAVSWIIPSGCCS